MGPKALAIDGPYELGRTMGVVRHGSGDPTARLNQGHLFWATRTPDGPVAVHLAPAEHGVDAEAHGPGADALLDDLPRIVGGWDNWRDFEPTDAVVAPLHRRSPGLRVPCTGRVFDALVPTILGQKVTTVEAHDGYRRLVYALGEPAPGPWKLWLPPLPERLREAGYAELHPLGIERKRAEIIRRVAREASRLEAVARDADALGRRLLHLPGIGPWTTGLVRYAVAGDADAVPVGDYNIPHLVGFTFEGTRRSTDERMLELLEPYRGHRGRVIRLLKGGAAPPRRGPKRAVRAIRQL